MAVFPCSLIQQLELRVEEGELRLLFFNAASGDDCIRVDDNTGGDEEGPHSAVSSDGAKMFVRAPRSVTPLAVF